MGYDYNNSHAGQQGRRRKRALFLLRYSSVAASSRVRLLQYRPYLEARGWDIHVDSFWDDEFLARLYWQGSRPPLMYARALSRRIRSLSVAPTSDYDVVITHQDVFPWMPYVLDSWGL